MSEIDFETHVNGYNLLDYEGSLKLKTGFTYLHNIRISIKNQKFNKVEKSHIEIFLNRPEGIAIDTSISLKESVVSIRTPWATEKSIILDVNLRFPKNIGVFDRKAIYVDAITLSDCIS
jgi:hypothetical protein